MQVFEFHFNPKAKEDTIFDSFIYEPENISEKRLGNLYIVGQLSNALPYDAEFLSNLVQVIKSEYYSNLQRSSESALRESLRKANEFLSKIAREGKVNWLGNLNFTILSIKEANLAPFTLSSNDIPFILNFAQVGRMKILLLRKDDILDISRDLEFQETEIYPLKIFENIVHGKLMLDDKIMILTRDVFSAFAESDDRKNENLIEDFAQIANKKSLNEILKRRKKALSKISGIFLFIVLTEAHSKIAEAFSFKKFLSRIPKLPPAKLKIKLPPFSPLPPLPQLPKPYSEISLLRNKLAFPKIQPFLSRLKPCPFFKKGGTKGVKKKIGLVLILTLILIISFFIFREEKKKELKETYQILEEIKAEKVRAENLLIFEDKTRANLLLQQALSKILPLTKKGLPLQSETKALKESIEESLVSLNQLEEIPNPGLFFEIPAQAKLHPKKMLLLDGSLYLFNPLKSNSLIQCFPETNELKETELQSISSEFNFALEISNQNRVNFDELCTYGSYLYSLDSKLGEIIKYGKNQEKFSGESWISPESKKSPVGAKSMTIDGNIWILTQDNKIDRYYQGIYKETLGLNIFPLVENLTKIWTNFNLLHLYLLEPAKNRLIILSKKGDILKQYQSEKFDNLLDFAVSEDGKTIYLLNGLMVYRINIEQEK